MQSFELSPILYEIYFMMDSHLSSAGCIEKSDKRKKSVRGIPASICSYDCLHQHHAWIPFTPLNIYYLAIRDTLSRFVHS